MSHTALARKYRPRRFAEVATQEHVSETLRRAVQGGRTGHAYLFCGPRGVGKTTLARVLAMSLNCSARSSEGEPCGECESCALIWSGRTSLDVVEIDAASNRGVEDARNLRERAMYAPSDEHRSKVYIVDEAHMLTREAWNALLKILEEPPPRVIFIFATTEPQRIQQSASPILSRCQRFDFRRVGVADIVARLEQVIGKEAAQASSDALRIIARKADGGMRDALSLLDQVLALSGGEVESRSVREVLGLVEEERYLELFDILLGHHHSEVFAFVEALVDEGYDLVEFYHGLVEALRLLLRVRLDGGEAVDAGSEYRTALETRAQDFESADLVRMLAMAADLEAQGSLKRVSQPRVLIELLLLRLSYLDRTVHIEELLKSLGGAPRPDVATPKAASQRPRPSRKPSGPKARTVAPRAKTAQPEARTAQPRARTAKGKAVPVQRDSAPAKPASSAVEAPPTGPALSAAPTMPAKSTPSAADATPAPSSVETVPARPVPSPAQAGADPPPASTPDRSDPAIDEPARRGASTPDPGSPSGPSPADPVAAFESLLQTGQGVPAGLRPFLRGAGCERVGDKGLRLTVAPGPGLDQLHRPGGTAGLADALAGLLGYRPRIEVEEGQQAGSSGSRAVSPGQVRQERLRELVEREPLLARAVEELDLELLD